jgi:GDP-L-fucose synthase
MNKKTKVFVAGHNGMVGSAIFRILKTKKNISLFAVDRKKLDLTNQTKVIKYFKKKKFDQVYIAAAKVGGIYANNTFPAEFIYDNLMIACNIMHASYITKVKKILFLGSSCIYPKFSTQPMEENELLKGELEPTNEPYAIAKIAGIKLCESYNRQYKKEKVDFRSVMPTNLYGIGDNYHPKNSHVIPALIRKIHLAKKKNLKEVEIWGSGNVFREFLFADDLANCCFELMKLSKKKFYQYSQPQNSHINIGSGKDITIKDLSIKICKIIDYNGKLKFNSSYPDGHPKKLLNIVKLKKLINLKFTEINEGLKISYMDYLRRSKSQ